MTRQLTVDFHHRYEPSAGSAHCRILNPRHERTASGHRCLKPCDCQRLPNCPQRPRADAPGRGSPSFFTPSGQKQVEGFGLASADHGGVGGGDDAAGKLDRVAAGQAVRWSDVGIDAGNPAVAFRREMEKLFAGAR